MLNWWEVTGGAGALQPQVGICHQSPGEGGNMSKEVGKDKPVEIDVLQLFSRAK